MNETLLDRAVFNYLQAQRNYVFSIGDERELNLVGYLLQQSLELALKHFLETAGVRYPYTHAIEDLLDMCENNHVRICYTDELYNFAPAFSKWEAQTRYIKNYVASKKQIERGFQLAADFLVSNGVPEYALDLPDIIRRDQIEPDIPDDGR